MATISNASEAGDKDKPIMINARDTDRIINDEPLPPQRVDKGAGTGAAQDETDSNADAEAEAEAVEAVYRSLLASICVEVACDVHRSAKTGTLPYSELMVPSDRPGGGRRRKRTSSGEVIVGDDEEDPSSSPAAEDGDARDTANNGDNKCSVDLGAGAGAGAGDVKNPTSGSGNSNSNSNSNSNCDVYGRVPPKEPKMPARCVLCGRTVSALRFAPHLDKCMGIGNRGGGGGNGVGGPGGAVGPGGGYGAGYGSSTRSGGAKLS